jgi:hypothetical protein
MLRGNKKQSEERAALFAVRWSYLLALWYLSRLKYGLIS